MGANGLVATNRPELFQSEMLPRRMPAARVRRLPSPSEGGGVRVGRSAGQPYVVAYGTLAGLSGDPVGALAVPLLYRQREIDAAIARALASILYVTVLVLVGVVVPRDDRRGADREARRGAVGRHEARLARRAVVHAAAHRAAASWASWSIRSTG